MSLGTSSSSDGTDTVSLAVNQAAEAGIIPVVAAGNSGPGRYTIGAPGAAQQAITVTAMADVSEGGFGLASFASRGPTRDDRIKPDIAGPGVAITAPRAGTRDGYITFSGTSMATPFVSGVIALMLAANPNLTVEAVWQILAETAEDWGLPGRDPDYGWGRLDAHAAVQRAGAFPDGSPPAVPAHVTIGGRIDQDGGQAEHPVTVSDTAYPLAVTMLMAESTNPDIPDLDLFLYGPDGQEVASSTGTNRQEQLSATVTEPGTYRLVVRSYRGTGDYVLDVSGAATDDTPDRPPTVAIEAPEEGATVTGTVTVLVRAADDRGLRRVEVAVDDGPYTDITGSHEGANYRYRWDTSSLGDGEHLLTARATDSAGQQTAVRRSVTVVHPDPPDPDRAHEITRTGEVTTGARDAWVTFTVHEPGYVDLLLNWQSAADLDFYVYAPDGRYAGRAYTLRNPERLRVDTGRWGTGAYRVKVNLYSGPDSGFTLTARGFGETRMTGTVTPEQREQVHPLTLTHTGTGQAVLSWPNASDLDLFVYDPDGTERARGYTLRNPETVSIPFHRTGPWTCRVHLYSGRGADYRLRVYTPEAVLS